MRTTIKTTALLVAALTLSGGVTASAQPFRGRVVVGPRVRVYAPLYDNPFWWEYGPYVPYRGLAAADDDRGDLRAARRHLQAAGVDGQARGR